jgi:hypothetical protein
LLKKASTVSKHIGPLIGRIKTDSRSKATSNGARNLRLAPIHQVVGREPTQRLLLSKPIPHANPRQIQIPRKNMTIHQSILPQTFLNSLNNTFRQPIALRMIVRSEPVINECLMAQSIKSTHEFPPIISQNLGRCTKTSKHMRKKHLSSQVTGPGTHRNDLNPLTEMLHHYQGIPIPPRCRLRPHGTRIIQRPTVP